MSSGALTVTIEPDIRGFVRAVDAATSDAERQLESRDERKAHGDPTLGGDGLRVAIDADCPHCGWPERFFETRSRRFGCIKCAYTSDERNA
jgi:ribosomal protein S27AE